VHVPERTAEAVRRLEQAGWVDVGKTNLHEFAYGVTSENPHFGTVPNPRYPGRIAGGSSGGSAAALAAGVADGALGSDSGGSIRIPAACCGITGFKPTFGRVPIDGCFPLAPSFDTAGPMANDLAGCAALLRALDDAFVPRELESLEEVRVGVAWTEHAEPLVRERVEGAASCFPRKVALALPEPADRPSAAFMREVADVHRELFAEHGESYGEEVAAKIERCLAVTDADYETDRRRRQEYRARVEAAAAEVDLVLTPTLRFVAPHVGAPREHVNELTRFTFPFNLLGWPALALPCGAAEGGLPASVQLVGKANDDALVLAAGALLERELSLD
jgi:aspartyl-tRNA(Asn)/glutamyl-tRNA(Gln) amidotransferase subunit A